MMKINKLLLLMFIFVSFIYGCEESESPALSDPNTISRNDTPYYIQVEKQEGDNTNTAFTFQVSKSGNALIDDKLYSVKWSLGDNTEKEGLKVEHKYADKGEYTVRAYITDITEDSLRSEEITVTAGVDPDIYNTKITAYKQEDRREYSFIASGVSSSGQELKYSWNFGDGTPATVAKKENSATHQFPKYGAQYTTKLTVDNGLGGADSKIETTIDIKTDLPDLSLECGSGGVRLSDNKTEVLGQTLECRPVLTGGMVPDALYNWNFYEEISEKEFEKLDQDNKTGWNLVADEVDYDKQVYRKIAGSSQSSGSSPTHFEFKDGGRKFVEATGSSQSFLTDNIEDNLTVNMPHNAILGLVTCNKANEGGLGTDGFQPASGLVWKCGAVGYAMPKFDNGTKYIAPLTEYKWTIVKHNGENQDTIIYIPLSGNYMEDGKSEVAGADEMKIQHEVRCYTSTNSSDWTRNQGYIIHERSDNLTKYDYSACKTFITYAAPKFDVDNENGETYTQAVLDVKYAGNVIAGEGEYTQTDINLSQSSSFKIAAPVLGDIIIQDDANNPLTKTFSTAGLKLEGASTNIDLSGVTYHWDFGDGTIGTSQDTNGTITHTYANADGQYDVTVYASHDKFERTDESTKRFTMSPEFLNSTFTVTQAANNPNTNNLWHFKTNIFAVVDCKPVDTNYQLIISGNGYTKTYNMGTLRAADIRNKVTLNNGDNGCTATIKNGADNVTNVTSVGITTANKNNNSVLSIPLSTAFNVELVVTSPAIEGEMRQSTVIPLPDLQDINVVHPAEINLENSFRWDYVRYSIVEGSKTTVIQNMNLGDAKCIYDFNKNNINDDLNGKWGYYVGTNKPGNKGGYTTITAGNSTVEVTCNQKVWVAQWTGQAINDVNKKRKVYTAVVQEKSPSITSNPFVRFLDILLENESY